MEVFKVSYVKLIVYIHPSQANNTSQAIRCQLSSMLFKFDEVFDGVVLAYEVCNQNTNANIVRNDSTNAKILPGIHPYFGVRLDATMLLFSPKPDMLLEGKVVKLAKESIHVIVLGFSSACITEEDVREEFIYKHKHGEEVYASKSYKRHVIKVGSMVRFLVKSMDEEILHISGSLLPSNTGSIKWLDKHMEEGPESERSFRKRHLEIQREMQLDGIGLLNDKAIQNNDQRSKNSKKRRSGEES